MTNRTLRWYAKRYYKKYWKKSLPKEVHVRFEQLDGAFGVTTFVGSPPVFVVSIDSDIRKWERLVKMTLLHELAHVALPVAVEHGSRFQAEMLRLARLHAFDGLW